MKVKFALWFERITTYFWVIPTSIVVFIVALLFFLKSTNIITGNSILQELLLVKASTDGARLLLSSIATAIMTVVGVLFSIILVVLQQISSQYSPRVVSNFTRSPMAQSVLGSYIGTFIYCLILLMNIGEKDLDPKSIPQLALAFSVALAIFCLILLVIYVHYVTKSIQSTDIISRITIETLESFDNVIKDRENCHEDDCKFQPQNLNTIYIIRSKHFGYIDSIDWKSLSEELPDQWEVTFIRSPGDFVQKEMPLIKIACTAILDERKLQQILKLIAISPMRTNSQDPKYGIQKISDIALKALSPGINDPSTAIEAIHSLTAILLRYFEKYPIRHEILFDKNRRMKFSTMEPKELIHYSFDQILQFGRDHYPVTNQIRRDLNFIKESVNIPELDNFIDGKLRGLASLQSVSNN
jgi:uncharacterized membrane protein